MEALGAMPSKATVALVHENAPVSAQDIILRTRKVCVCCDGFGLCNSQYFPCIATAQLLCNIAVQFSHACVGTLQQNTS